MRAEGYSRGSDRGGKKRWPRERNPILTTPLKLRLAGEQNWRCCCCGARVGVLHHLAEDTMPGAQRLATFLRVTDIPLSQITDVDLVAVSCDACNQGAEMLERMSGSFGAAAHIGRGGG